MHIANILRTLTGQKKGDYSTLNSTLSFNFYHPLSSEIISITFKGAAGATFETNTNDNYGSWVERELTGEYQTITKSYYNKENTTVSIDFRGFGVSTISEIIIDGCNSLQYIHFNTATTSKTMYNLKKLSVTNCPIFTWDSTTIWSLLPRLNTLILSNNAALKSFPVINGSLTNSPKKLIDIRLDNTALTGCNIKNYSKLENVSLSGNQNIISASFEGCSGLKNMILTNTPSISSLNLTDCSGIKKVELDSTEYLKSISLKNCSSMEDLSMIGVNKRGSSSSFSIDYSGCDSLANLHIEDSVGSWMLPAPEYTPKLSVLDLSTISASSNDNTLNLSNYTSLTDVKISDILQLTNITCDGNTSLKNIQVIDNEKLDNVEIRNCSKLQSILIDGDGVGDVEYLEITNCQSLEEAEILDCSLKYGFTINTCPKLSKLTINRTDLTTFTVNDLPSLYEFIIDGDEDTSSSVLNTLTISECPSLRYGRLRYHDSLNTLNVINCTNDALYFDNRYCTALNSITFDGVNIPTNDYDTFFEYLLTYTTSPGTITIKNSSTMPSEETQQNILDSGWTFITI